MTGTGLIGKTRESEYRIFPYRRNFEWWSVGSEEFWNEERQTQFFRGDWEAEIKCRVQGWDLWKRVRKQFMRNSELWEVGTGGCGQDVRKQGALELAIFSWEWIHSSGTRVPNWEAAPTPAEEWNKPWSLSQLSRRLLNFSAVSGIPWQKYQKKRDTVPRTQMSSGGN